MEFEMSSLTPATHYTVKVYAVRDMAKSAATTTEFTTGEQSLLKVDMSHLDSHRGTMQASGLKLQMYFNVRHKSMIHNCEMIKGWS